MLIGILYRGNKSLCKILNMNKQMMVYYCHCLYDNNNFHMILLKEKKIMHKFINSNYKTKLSKWMIVIVVFNNNYYDSVKPIFKTNVLNLG